MGLWRLVAGRDGLGSNANAHGLQIDYPNDLWDVALTFKGRLTHHCRIGDEGNES